MPHFAARAAITGGGATTRSYASDVAGNTVSRPGANGAAQTLSWDAQGDLVSVSEGDLVSADGNAQTAQMAYAADGSRVVRREGTKTTLYVAGAEISLADGGTPEARRYYSLAGLAVAMRTGDQPGQTTTLAPDWQDTVRHQIDNATGELRTSLQTPYGGDRGQMPAGWAGERGFVGGVKDATGLTRIGARDYDPLLERFVTVDPLQDLNDPLQWNAYLYANNTPLTMSDPSGEGPIGNGDPNDPGKARHPRDRKRSQAMAATPAHTTMTQNPLP